MALVLPPGALAHRFNAERHAIGQQGFEEVAPFVERILGEPITPTAAFYDTMDAESEHWLIEIKKRTAKYHYTDKVIQKEGWLIPLSKVKRGYTSDKRVVFYYFWEQDKTLWELEFHKELFDSLTPAVPWFHKQRQLHYYVHQDHWSLITEVD